MNVTRRGKHKSTRTYRLQLTFHGQRGNLVTAAVGRVESVRNHSFSLIQVVQHTNSARALRLHDCNSTAKDFKYLCPQVAHLLTQS